jgi:hypothetical protein
VAATGGINGKSWPGLLNNWFQRRNRVWRGQASFGLQGRYQAEGAGQHLMIKVEFDAKAEAGLALVVEPPAVRLAETDNQDAAESLFRVLARQPDEGVSRSQLR